MKRICLLMLCLPLFSSGQTLVDERDGQEYAYTTIGPLDWMSVNLKYQCEGSWQVDFPKKAERKKTDANFYSLQVLDSVCPANWRIPTKSEWLAAFDTVRVWNGWNEDVLQYTEKYGTHYFENIAMLREGTPWNFEPIGWVEAGKQKDQKTANVWIYDEESDDPKTHLHIGPNGFNMHSHEHNILPGHGKIRMFSVRCVRDH